ncbi:MAG: hypothetical protein HOQ09_00005, partial [Gemmatimonadaceae bacterium]|nr:hypothetical protein [Gemmatimonadaceae bacterium]
MPLVAIALLCYGGGLLAGLHGTLGMGAALVAALLLVALGRRRPAVAAFAAMAAAGIAAGRGAERADHGCATTIVARREWLLVPDAPLAPGEMVPVV